MQQDASSNFKFLHNKITKEMIPRAQELLIETKLILKVYDQLLENDPKLANSSLDIKVTTKMNQGNLAKLQAIKIKCKMIGKFLHTLPIDKAQKALEKQVNPNPIPIPHLLKQNRISHRWLTTRATST
jgi:hypothetical protein